MEKRKQSMEQIFVFPDFAPISFFFFFLENYEIMKINVSYKM